MKTIKNGFIELEMIFFIFLFLSITLCIFQIHQSFWKETQNKVIQWRNSFFLPMQKPGRAQK